MTGIPWEEVKDWLTENGVRFAIKNDASVPTPVVDLTLPAVFGEGKKARLFTEPGSTYSSANTNLKPFDEVHIVETAVSLGLDAKQMPSVGAGGQTMVDAVLRERGELGAVVQEEESYASVEDPTSEQLEDEEREQEEETELAEKIFEDSE